MVQITGLPRDRATKPGNAKNPLEEASRAMALLGEATFYGQDQNEGNLSR